MSYKHPIDISFISTQIGDSPEIILEMSTVFLEVLHEYQQYINIGIREEDFDSIRLHAHKIKPSLAMFGLNDLLTLVASIEKAAYVDKDLLTVIELSGKIEKELPIIYHQVNELIEKNQ